MTDSELLKDLISQKGMKLKYVAEELGLSSYGFMRKVNNLQEFKCSEIKALCELLKIDNFTLLESIFFTDGLFV